MELPLVSPPDHHAPDSDTIQGSPGPSLASFAQSHKGILSHF